MHKAYPNTSDAPIVSTCIFAILLPLTGAGIGTDGEKSATKRGKIRKNGRKRENWEENGNLVPADGKGWLRPWPLAGAIP